MILIFISSFQRGFVRRSGNNLFKQEKVFQISGVILATEQIIKSLSFVFLGFWLYFKSTFMKKSMNNFWNDFSRTPHDGCFCKYMFYFAIDYENEPYMKVAASDVNIKTHQLFFKQRILSVRVTIAQRKISRGLDTNWLLNNVQTILSLDLFNAFMTEAVLIQKPVH